MKWNFVFVIGSMTNLSYAKRTMPEFFNSATKVRKYGSARASSFASIRLNLISAKIFFSPEIDFNVEQKDFIFLISKQK